MRKLLLMITYLFLVKLTSIKAQSNTKLFRFVSKYEHFGVKEVLFHDLTTNKLEVKPTSFRKYTRTNGYLESFILIPAGNKGEVYIASAKAPEYFIKTNNGSGVPTGLYKRTKDDDENDFKWSVCIGDNNGDTVFLQSHNPGDGYETFFGSMTISSHYFRMESITNVF